MKTIDSPEARPIKLFPKWKYHRTGKPVIVNDAAEEVMLGEGWGDSPAGPFGLSVDLNPMSWLDSGDFHQLSSDARVRISTGLLEAHADVLESGPDDGSRVRQVSMQRLLDRISGEYLAAGLLNESMLRESIPRMVYDAAVLAGWETGTPERNARRTLKFGHYWVPDNVPKRLTELFAPQVLRWRTRLLESQLESREPVHLGTPAPSDSAQPGSHTAQTKQPITVKVRKEAVMEEARRHGFEADQDRHNAIADIVGRHYAPWRNHSTGWRKDAVLKSICSDLDEGEIDIPTNWKTGKTPSLAGSKLRDWNDALELGYKKLIIDTIRYSLDKATTVAPRETKSLS